MKGEEEDCLPLHPMVNGLYAMKFQPPLSLSAIPSNFSTVNCYRGNNTYVLPLPALGQLFNDETTEIDVGQMCDYILYVFAVMLWS